jgi:hypothetical protein
MQGNDSEADIWRGRTLKINIRIGYLIFYGCGTAAARVSFEANPIDQIIMESKEQNDDMMSKMSSISQLSKSQF